MGEFREKLKNIIYYILIGVVSFISMVVLPMVESQVDGGFAWPKGPLEWFIWLTMRISSAVVNVLIFHCFMCQAKINVHDDPKYMEANEILHRLKKKIHKPRSPQAWNGKQYGVKATTIFAFSVMSTIAITSAVITYNWLVLLAFTFTVTMGLVFGIIQMKSAEIYWTTEYYDYAIMIKLKDEEEAAKVLEVASQKLPEQRNDNLRTDLRGDILVPGVNPRSLRPYGDGDSVHCVLGDAMDSGDTDSTRDGCIPKEAF